MPAKSEKQKKLFAIAMSIKRGKTSKSYSKEAAEIAENLPEHKIREFTKKIAKKAKRKKR